MSQSKLKYEQRLALIQRLERRLDKLDDERLVEMENRTRAQPRAVDAGAAPGLSRRSFLRDILLYTGAGLAVGGAAAVAKDRWDAGHAQPGSAAGWSARKTMRRVLGNGRPEWMARP